LGQFPQPPHLALPLNPSIRAEGAVKGPQSTTTNLLPLLKALIQRRKFFLFLFLFTRLYLNIWITFSNLFMQSC
jgi:hypothetical protein